MLCLFSPVNVGRPVIQATASKRVTLQDLPSELQEQLEQTVCTDDLCTVKIFQVSSVSNGLATIQCNNAYPKQWDDREMPLFFVVRKIVRCRHVCYFSGTVLKTSFFDRRYWGYVCHENEDSKVVSCSETSIDCIFLDNRPVVVYECDGELVSVVQYGIFPDELV